MPERTEESTAERQWIGGAQKAISHKFLAARGTFAISCAAGLSQPVAF